MAAGGRRALSGMGRGRGGASQPISLARASGEIGKGDVMVMALWNGRDLNDRPLQMPMPASRWIGDLSSFSPGFEALSVETSATSCRVRKRSPDFTVRGLESPRNELRRCRAKQRV